MQVHDDRDVSPTSPDELPGLAARAGQQVRFRFHLSRGSLYAFWVTQDAGGASNGYVAAGGPAFTETRDQAL